MADKKMLGIKKWEGSGSNTRRVYILAYIDTNIEPGSDIEGNEDLSSLIDYIQGYGSAEVVGYRDLKSGDAYSVHDNLELAAVELGKVLDK